MFLFFEELVVQVVLTFVSGVNALLIANQHPLLSVCLRHLADLFATLHHIIALNVPAKRIGKEADAKDNVQSFVADCQCVLG